MMKTNFLVVTFLCLVSISTGLAQQKIRHFRTRELQEKAVVFNRKVSFTEDAIYFDSQPGDGFLRINDFIFKNGTIEADIKGKSPEQNFVGIAFHGVNDSTYDAIYFRPFNFENPNRKDHSVQYISHPTYTWDKLRADSPGKYEKALQVVPNPNDWFHVRIEVKFPTVKVFVNNTPEPVLTVNQLNTNQTGWLGFWVGNYSDGYFKNLRIMSTP